MDSLSWFAVLLGLVVLERLAELILSKRHAAWALSEGGVEHGRGHYPPMVVLHTALLLAAFGEAWLADRPFLPWLGWPMLVVVVAAQGLRWWCIATLGRQWNTRVIVVPRLRLVERGPYRLLRHPNYLAVVAEGIALPLVHTSWVTAVVFTALNAWLLTVRIRTEDAALASVR